MTAPRRVTVGCRSSPLALAQTEEVLASLRRRFAEVEFVVARISTRGDRDKDAPLLSMARGMFVREFEDALLAGEIDFAVHSAKDVPSDVAEGLTVRAVGTRADPRDALVDRWRLPLRDLPAGARLGTSSPRRSAQLRRARPDVEVVPIRGNVGTRLAKAVGHGCDGVVLAAAGLSRLGLLAEVTEYLDVGVCTPDVGQGTLAAQARADDAATLELLAAVSDPATVAGFEAERAFLAAVGGGCKSPVAAYARLDGSRLHVVAMASSVDGARLFRVADTLDARDPAAAGRRVARTLLAAGAASVLAPGEGA